MLRKNKFIILALILLFCVVILVACGTGMSQKELRSAAKSTRLAYRFTDAFEALSSVRSVTKTDTELNILVRCDAEQFDFGSIVIPATQAKLYPSREATYIELDVIDLELDVPFTAYLYATSGETVAEYDITILRAHDFDEWTYTGEPTCTAEGSRERHCDLCGLNDVEVIEALGHDYGDWTEIRPVTCLEESERARTCRRCEYVDQEITPAPGHDLVHHEGKASCTEPGWAPYDTCKNCDYTTFTVLPVSGHKEVTDPARDATCTEDGCSEGSHCEQCGMVFVAQTIYTALGHDFVEEIHTDATCTNDGLIVRRCKTCQIVERETLAAFGHSFNGDDVCTRCGYRVAEGLVYRLESDSYVVESIGTFNGSDLYVPATYEGKSVVGIGERAFAGATFLKKVVLTSEIAYISSDAFYGCSALEEISAPSAIFYNTEILANAFGKIAEYTVSGNYYKNNDGQYVSPSLAHNNSTTMRVTFTSAGRFDYSCRVSSEGGCDFLYVYFNGQQLNRISGEWSYTDTLASVNVGDVLTFTYAKDGSVVRGSDCAFIGLPEVTGISHSLKTVTLTDTNGKCEAKIFYANGAISGVSFDKDVWMSDYTENTAQRFPLYFNGTDGEWKAFCRDHSAFANKQDVYFYSEGHGGEHSWHYVDAVPTVGPYGTHTFENEGYTCVDRVCSCGYTIPAATVDPVHKYFDRTTSTPATCTAEGERTRTCSLCGHVERERIGLIAHTLGDWTESKPATCTEDGERVKECTVCHTVLEREAIPATSHRYVDGKCTVCGADEPTFIRLNAAGEEDAEGMYLLFGEYPQSRVTDDDLCAALTEAAGPRSGQGTKWVSYEYYINGNTDTTFMWYADISHDGARYRGVYFSLYRPNNTNASSSANYSRQDECGYYTSTYYWFRYDPIRWRILEENDGEALLLAEMILDGQEFYATRERNDKFEHNGGTGYANNYELSNIRKWLNDTFYNTAFDPLEKQSILRTIVDNSVRTWYPNNDTTERDNNVDNAVANTEDYIFLLSVQEVTTNEYGFSTDTYMSHTRAKYSTDYAQAQGVGKGEVSNNGVSWLLRSIDVGSSYITRIVDYGDCRTYGGYVYQPTRGVVPALRIRLHEPTPPAYTRVDAEGAEAEDGKYLLFGSYPQTQVTDGGLVATLNGKAGALPTASGSGNWTSYGYYKSGVDTTAYMWYIDLVEGGAKYRGVYFTSYRPYYTTADGTAENSFQDENGYIASTAYWFAYEPIKWRILTEGEGEALILAELILDSQQFNYGNDSYNLYRDSTIRTWLNDTFYNTAFTALQRDVILLTEVENGTRTTNPDGNASEWNYGANNNAYGNTQDYVFLLSEQEVTMESYGFDPDTNGFDEARKKNTTDYAQAQGAYTTVTTDIEGKGRWWLRSPHYSVVNYTYTVRNSGTAEYLTNYIRSTDTGVVPALRIRLTTSEQPQQTEEPQQPQEPQQPSQEVSAAYTRVDAEGNASEQGEYVLFGSYPQTQVTDSDLIAALNEAADGIPTPSAPGLWREYDYYVNGDNEYVYMWYTDRKYEGERYRGVYFTSYRPYRTNLSGYSSDYSYQDDNGYYVSTAYWFKYEPIKWRILEEENGEAFLLSEMILDSRDYYADASAGTFAHNGGEGYANNYVLSNIRKWLNDTFYTTAFKSAEKAIILTTSVENSARSTSDAGNNLAQATRYAAGYTEDYVYLLSLQEVTSPAYGFDSDYNANDPARRKKATAYAKAQGEWVYTSVVYLDNGYWWLRSPSNSYDNSVTDVSPTGNTGSGSNVSMTFYGVVPALRIRLASSEQPQQPEEPQQPQEPQQPSQEVSAAYTRVDAEGNASENGEYVLFGTYPQSKVTDEALLFALNAAAGSLPTADDSRAWTSYEYYDKGSNDTDFMWYKDVEQEGNQYRGVYFTQYRPYRTTLSSFYGNSYQDDNGYYPSTVYWFKYEPIKWRILETANGEALIFAELILDSQAVHLTESDFSFAHNDGTGYANNYALSDIRKWLNDTFYNMAFSTLEKSIISLTAVRNDITSANPKDDMWNNGVNSYLCENVEDYVFLLSEEDATNSAYGFSASPSVESEMRKKKGTDYAKAQGVWVNGSSGYEGNVSWWLRSPSYTSAKEGSRVYSAGTANGGSTPVVFTSGGIAPALKIRL